MSGTRAIANFIQSHAFQIAAQIFTVAGLLLAAYVTARIAPLAATLTSQDFRISAIEKRNEKVDPLVERFYTVEGVEKQNSQNIQEIKQAVKDIQSDMKEVHDLQIRQYIYVTGKQP